MRLVVFILPVLLVGCALPGRQTFRPAPVGADTQSVAARTAFADRVPLVSILPGTTDFAGPVAEAVREARAIKPGAHFDVEAQSPQAATPDASARNLQALTGTAGAVAQAIVADGVAPGHVALTAKTTGLDAVINVYVR